MTPDLKARLLGLDPRSLTAFRVALGAMLVADAVDRARDAGAHYGANGAVPLRLVFNPNRPMLPFELAGADLAALWLLLLAVAGVALMVGWFSRAAAFVGWLITISLQARDPLVLYGSDVVLRMMLWWAILLPTERLASFDRRAGRAAPPPEVEEGFAPAAYTLQIAILYFATYVLKHGKTWHDGTAGWYAVHIDAWTGPIGVAMRDWPGVLAAGTHITLLIEMIGPFLLFVPRATWAFRLAVIGAFYAFHIGLEVALQIGWFPEISLICWLPLMPAQVWDRLGWRFDPAAPPALGPLHRIGEGLTIASFLTIAWWNVATWMPNYVSVVQPIRKIALITRQDQLWNMYAPNPAMTDGWFQIDATLEDGKHIDLITGKKPTKAKPADVPGLYGGSRWNKFMHGLWEPSWDEHRAPALQWWCRTWNADAPEGQRAVKATLMLIREKSPAPGEEQPAAEPHKLASVDCE